MSARTKQIADHSVWQAMPRLGAAIDTALGRESVSDIDRATLERVRAVLSVIGQRLAAADPELLHPSAVDAIASAFESAAVDVETFAGNGDSAPLDNANNSCDNALRACAELVVPSHPGEWEQVMEAAVAHRRGLEAAVSALRTSTEDALRELSGKEEWLREKLSDLGAQLSAEKDRLVAVLAEFQGQFSTAQETRSQEFATVQASRQTRFQELIDEYSGTLKAQESDFESKKDAVLASEAQNVAMLTEQYSAKAAAILDGIEEHRRQVEKLVGVIGNLGVTSGYVRAANHARTAMWMWQLVTVASLGGLIWLAYRAFLPVAEGEFRWEGFAGRVFVSLTVGVLAAYAAKQGDRQADIERTNRRLALEFEAIGPYLAPLPEAEQHRFRVALGERSFGRDEIGRNLASSPATLMDLFVKSKAFEEAVSAVVKAAKK